MKIFVFCICILVFASCSLANIKQHLQDQIENIANDVGTCIEENNMNEGDWYSVEEIISKLYDEIGQEERKRKNGCTIECILKKNGYMEGSNINERKIHIEISKDMIGSMEAKTHQIARDCLKKAKNFTEECEKGFSLITCVTKAIRAEHENEHEK